MFQESVEVGYDNSGNLSIEQCAVINSQQY